MRHHWKVLTAVLLGASACNAIRPPVRAVFFDPYAGIAVQNSQPQPGRTENGPSDEYKRWSSYPRQAASDSRTQRNGSDIFDQVEAEDSAASPSPYECGRTWLWQLGSVRAEDPKMVFAFSVGRFAITEAILIAVASAVFWVWVRVPGRVQVVKARIRAKLYLLPMIVYVGLAIFRLTMVPCTEVLRCAYGARPAVLQAFVVPIWQLGTESVRYDLILFEEFALLGAVAGLYTVVFALYPSLRPTWIRDHSTKFRGVDVQSHDRN